MESQARCQDADWMREAGVNTYYPPGTVCYRDPSQGVSNILNFQLYSLYILPASCVEFGSSGSGVVREYKEYKVDRNGDR